MEDVVSFGVGAIIPGGAIGVKVAWDVLTSPHTNVNLGSDVNMHLTGDSRIKWEVSRTGTIPIGTTGLTSTSTTTAGELPAIWVPRAWGKILEPVAFLRTRQGRAVTCFSLSVAFYAWYAIYVKPEAAQQGYSGIQDPAVFGMTFFGCYGVVSFFAGMPH